MKKIFLLIACQAYVLTHSAQVVYNNAFDNLSLQTYTTAGSTTLYTTVPSGFTLINDGWLNNTGTPTNPNAPFHVPALSTTGWAVLYNQAENDTFLVSTSWLDTTLVSSDRWVITPPVSNITNNTVFTWRAKSPDPVYPDGYEVYATLNPAASSLSDFPIGNRLFALADGNTVGFGELSTWTRHSINLSPFVGQTMRFAFRENSKDMYQLWIDDIEVITLPYNLDGALTSDMTKKYALVNATDSVWVNLANTGAAVITGVTLSYQVGNSSINTENFSFANGLAYGQSSLVKFALPYSVTQPGYYIVKSWIASVNGQADQNLANDTTRYSVTIQNTAPKKHVLFEQFVSANNGEGPDAQDRGIALQNDSVIVVNIHDQDSMREASSAALLSDYKKNYATAMADRVYFSDAGMVAAPRPYYNDHVATRLSSVSPLGISILNKSFNAATNQLSFTLKADFAGEVRGDYRLNAYLTENQVGGPISDTTINGYNQWNNSYDVPWSQYYQKGYYSPVADTYILTLAFYRHQNVLVYAFNGAYGNSGTIPSTGGTVGQSYQQSFSVTIPSPPAGINKFNPDNLYIVGFAAEYDSDKNSRHVLNAVKEKLTSNAEVVGIEEITIHPDLSVYPNPSEGVFYFNFKTASGPCTISVYNMLGKCLKVAETSGSPGLETLDLSALPNGVYFLNIRTGGLQVTKKVIIQKGQN